MIPPFNDDGVLPPGVHPATLDEIEARFARQSEIRAVQMQSVRWLVELAVKAGAERIILNGSFVTDIMEPNDVDCAVLAGRGFPADPTAEAELRAGLPFLDIAIVRLSDFTGLVDVVFATDRLHVPKGMVEVVL
jgi:hypothetical protein